MHSHLKKKLRCHVYSKTSIMRPYYCTTIQKCDLDIQVEHFQGKVIVRNRKSAFALLTSLLQIINACYSLSKNIVSFFKYFIYLTNASCSNLRKMSVTAKIEVFLCFYCWERTKWHEKTHLSSLGVTYHLTCCHWGQTWAIFNCLKTST